MFCVYDVIWPSFFRVYLKFTWLKTSKNSISRMFSYKILTLRRHFRTFWMPWRHVRWFVGDLFGPKTTKRDFFSVCRSGKFSTWRMTHQKQTFPPGREICKICQKCEKWSEDAKKYAKVTSSCWSWRHTRKKWRHDFWIPIFEQGSRFHDQAFLQRFTALWNYISLLKKFTTVFLKFQFSSSVRHFEIVIFF